LLREVRQSETRTTFRRGGAPAVDGGADPGDFVVERPQRILRGGFPAPAIAHEIGAREHVVDLAFGDDQSAELLAASRLCGVAHNGDRAAQEQVQALDLVPEVLEAVAVRFHHRPSIRNSRRLPSNHGTLSTASSSDAMRKATKAG